MDWALAIERNRQPLLRIVAVLCSMIGLGEGSFVARVSRPVHRAVLSVLRPAEAAVRRLIVVAARGIVVNPKTPRTAPAGRISSCRMRQGRVSFQLFDPRRVLVIGHGWRAAGTRGEPRIHVIDVVFDPRIPLFRPAPAVASDEPDPPEDHTVDAGPLCRRLVAIRSALEDLPRQAKRYARWRARPPETRRPKRLDSLRTGPPPGLRRKPIHEVDEILAECHWLARHAQPPTRHECDGRHAQARLTSAPAFAIDLGSVSTAPVTTSCCRHRESGGAGAARQARRRGPRPESTEGSAASCRAPEHSCPTLR